MWGMLALRASMTAGAAWGFVLNLPVQMYGEVGAGAGVELAAGEGGLGRRKKPAMGVACSRIRFAPGARMDSSWILLVELEQRERGVRSEGGELVCFEVDLF
jgi:hypothetical protein